MIASSPFVDAWSETNNLPGKSNAHSIVNAFVTGGSFLVGAIAVTVGAPVVAIGAAGVGIGYGLFSIFGGDILINSASNDWGSKIMYPK